MVQFLSGFLPYNLSIYQVFFRKTPASIRFSSVYSSSLITEMGNPGMNPANFSVVIRFLYAFVKPVISLCHYKDAKVRMSNFES